MCAVSVTISIVLCSTWGGAHMHVGGCTVIMFYCACVCVSISVCDRTTKTLSGKKAVTGHVQLFPPNPNQSH